MNKHKKNSDELELFDWASTLVEGQDYYLDDYSQKVLTEEYLRKRGKCCGSGCRHCPYGFKKEPNKKS